MGHSSKGQASGPCANVHSPICECAPYRSKFSEFFFIVKPYLVSQINGFTIFLAEQITKEIAYHIVFRINRTCKFMLILADLDPAAFRHAPHPPLDTLALVGSSVSAFDSPGVCFVHFCHISVTRSCWHG